MKLTTCQKAAAWAVVQVMFAGCGAGGPTNPAPHAPAPAPKPAPVPVPAPTPAPTSPSITAQPVDSTVLTGGLASFSVTAKGTNVTYQWKKNGTAIAGATASTYQAPAATWQDEGAQYTVVVSNSAGSVTSTAAVEHLKLSADQQVFEQFELAPSAGVYETIWNLNYVGTQSSPADYMYYDYAALDLSPLTHGTQYAIQQAPVNLTQHLAIPPAGVSRVLKNGVVLVVPGLQDSFHITYVGSAIQVDNLAADNATVAYSAIRSNFSTAALTGLLHSAPTEFTNPYNAVFGNPGVMDTTTSWGAGAAYLKFTQTNLGDRYNVVDCTGTTTGTVPNPCQSGTTLAAAMTAGETSSSDGVTYHTADGATSIVGGVPIWVARQPRPSTATNAYTVEYRIYYELNGNVYTGNMIKDGTVVSSSRYRTVPADFSTEVYLSYAVRINKEAALSLAAGSLL